MQEDANTTNPTGAPRCAMIAMGGRLLHHRKLDPSGERRGTRGGIFTHRNAAPTSRVVSQGKFAAVHHSDQSQPPPSSHLPCPGLSLSTSRRISSSGGGGGGLLAKPTSRAAKPVSNGMTGKGEAYAQCKSQTRPARGHGVSKGNTAFAAHQSIDNRLIDFESLLFRSVNSLFSFLSCWPFTFGCCLL